MDRNEDGRTAKKRYFRSVYLDAATIQALDFLKTHRHGSGLRFSVSAFMHELLEFLAENPARTLDAERHAARNLESGKTVSMALSPADIELIDRLTDYYQEHAKPSRRVRDGVPKVRKLPLSPLFASFLRESAAACGWTPKGI